MRTWDLFLDQAHAFDGFERAADVVLVAGAAGKNQRVEDNIFDGNSESFAKQAVGALGDFQFALASECLGLNGVFVDASDDYRGAVGAGERADAFEFFFAIFEIDGIDDAFALAIGERELDGARIGGIDHDRGFDFAVSS